MAEDTVVMTAQALADLEAEIERLETVDRAAIAARIKTAREWGDLKENAEYHDAKNDQAHLETKIKRLRHHMLSAEIRTESTSTSVVGFGSVVEVQDEATGKNRSYTLVSATEAVPGEGRISIESPMGKALEGATVGSTVIFATPKGERRMQVVSIG